MKPLLALAMAATVAAAHAEQVRVVRDGDDRLTGVTSVDVVVSLSPVAALRKSGTELVGHVQGIPEADRDAPAGAWGSLLVGELSLARESTMNVSPPAAHAVQVEATVVEQLAAVGERMRRANP